MPDDRLLLFSRELRLATGEQRNLAKILAEVMYPTAWPQSAAAQFFAETYLLPGTFKEFLVLRRCGQPLGLVLAESFASYSVLNLVAAHPTCWGKGTGAALDLALSRLSAKLPIIVKLANPRSLTLFRRRGFRLFDQPDLSIWQSEVRAFVAMQGADQRGARVRLASLPSSPWVPISQVGHPDDEHTLSRWQERRGDRVLLLRPPDLVSFQTVRRT